MAAQAPRIADTSLARLSPAPRRVLIKAVNWLGDLVMTQPAMRAVRRAFPDAHLAVLIKQELAGFFDGADWIDETIGYSLARGLYSIGDRARIVRAIRARRFELAVLMPNSFESALWATAAGVPLRAGFASDMRGAMLTHKARPGRDALDGHQVYYWLAMVRDALGIEGDPSDLALTPDAPAVVRMQQWLACNRRHPSAPLVAIAPAAAYGPAKEWPAERFALLIDRLRERFGAESVLVGARSERSRCARVAHLSRHGALVSAGDTDVAELIALLALSSAFVGNDSGCTHLAGALGIPAVAIFGSTDPIRTGPLGRRTRVIRHRLECSPCLARTCRFGHYDCLKQIEAEQALEALITLEAFGIRNPA